jgi:hypothetical protein
MKAGGKLLGQEREEQRRKESEREKEREQRKAQDDWNTSEYSSFDLYGTTLKNSDPDLFQLVIKAVRWFT